MAARSAGSEALRHRMDQHLDREEEESFPASDAHGDWAGPPLWLPAVAESGDAGGPPADADRPDPTPARHLP